MVQFGPFIASASELIGTKSIWSAQFNKQEIVKLFYCHFGNKFVMSTEKISCHRHWAAKKKKS